MSPRIVIPLSPFILAVLIGLAVPNIDEPAPQPTGPMTDFSMTRYLWQRRPIVIFSPSVADPRYQEAVKVLGRNPKPLVDREVVVGEVVHPGWNQAEGRAIPRGAAREIRDVFEVKPEEFAIVLVGKDGTAKGKWEDLPPLREIYEQIDAMPMRQQEIQAQAAVAEGGNGD
jgi:hypothetical protein